MEVHLFLYLRASFRDSLFLPLIPWGNPSNSSRISFHKSRSNLQATEGTVEHLYKQPYANVKRDHTDRASFREETQITLRDEQILVWLFS